MRVALFWLLSVRAFADTSAVVAISKLDAACPRAACDVTPVVVSGPGPIVAARLLETISYEPAHGHDGGRATVRHLRLALRRGSRWFVTPQLFVLRHNPGGHASSQNLLSGAIEQSLTAATWRWNVDTDWDDACAGMSGEIHEKWQLAIRVEGDGLSTEAPRRIARSESSHSIADEPGL